MIALGSPNCHRKNCRPLPETVTGKSRPTVGTAKMTPVNRRTSTRSPANPFDERHGSLHHSKGRDRPFAHPVLMTRGTGLEAVTIWRLKAGRSNGGRIFSVMALSLVGKKGASTTTSYPATRTLVTSATAPSDLVWVKRVSAASSVHGGGGSAGVSRLFVATASSVISPLAAGFRIRLGDRFSPPGAVVGRFERPVPGAARKMPRRSIGGAPEQHGLRTARSSRGL